MKKLILIVFSLLVYISFIWPQMIDSMFDETVDISQLSIRQVAIIPNRLPLVLQETELWRRKNWEIIRATLEQYGLEVLPYERTLQAAKEAALPLEDTLSSEDKFYNFCRITDTDLVIMPYYGTGFRMTPLLLVMQSLTYISTVSLQFYTPEQNVFFHRTDASGSSGYTSGIGSAAALVTMLLQFPLGASDIFLYISAGLGGAGLIYDSINAFTPPNTWWEKSFRQAIQTALEPIISYLQGTGQASPFSSGDRTTQAQGGEITQDRIGDWAFELTFGGTYLFSSTILLPAMLITNQTSKTFAWGAGFGLMLQDGTAYPVIPARIILGDRFNNVGFGLTVALAPTSDVSPVFGDITLYVRNFFISVMPTFFLDDEGFPFYLAAGYTFWL